MKRPLTNHLIQGVIYLTAQIQYQKPMHGVYIG